MKIVLASGSAQRKLILERLGIDFIVDVSDADEDLSQPLPPEKLVIALALKKALTVATRHPRAIVIGADTVLVTGKKVFGKHTTATDVRKTLRFIRGKIQRAVTGVAIVDTRSNKRSVFAVSTIMKIRELSDREIRSYARSREWIGMAGGYSALGIGGTFIERIVGNYDNIVGLPVPQTIRALEKFGVRI